MKILFIKGQFTEMTKKNPYLLLVLSGHALSFAFICPHLEISVLEISAFMMHKVMQVNGL